MPTLQLFDYSGQQVRTQLIDGEPWFVIADICKVLDLSNPTKAAQSLDSDDLSTSEVIDSMGRAQNARITNESGVYQLVFQSRKPEAKDFRRWVTKDVLPAIRKTGSYSTAPALPQTYSDALRELLATVEAREIAEARAKELETPAAAWGIMVGAGSDYSVEQAAKMLSRDPDIELGRNRLFTLMQEIGWTYRQGSRNSWHAYQSQVDNGRLVLRMSAAFLNAKTGEMENPAPTIRITAKGVDALRARLLAVTV